MYCAAAAAVYYLKIIDIFFPLICIFVDE